MRTTFPVVTNTILSKAGLDSVRSGEILSVKITENNKGLIKAVIKGKVIILKGSADLRVGKTIKVRAQWSGKTLLLNRVDDKNGIKNIISESGIKNNNLSMLLFEAARRSGLSLKDENLSLLKKLLKQKKELNREEARTAVESIKKGLSAEEMTAVAGSANSEDRKEREKNLLFNHLKDGEELWFIIPYNFTADERSLEGTMRIRKNVVMHEIITVVLEVKLEEGRLFFLIDDYNTKKQKIRFITDGKITAKTKKIIIKRLPQFLGNMRQKIDDNVIKGCLNEQTESLVFDGYSLTESTLKGIEEVV